VALSAFIFPERKASLQEMVKDEEVVRSYPLDTMAVDELAFRLIHEDRSLQVIDFRPTEAFSQLSLPGSTSFTIDNLFEKEPNRVLTLRQKTNVFVAEDEFTERQIAIMATELGYTNIRVLRGGLAEFRRQFLDGAVSFASGIPAEERTLRFHEHARKVLPELIRKSTPAGPVKKTQKRVLGGC
jgi:rhodanese-related sulfurtransferase